MNQVDIDINGDVFNPVYIPYLNDERPLQIFFGGSSSGKSKFLAQRCIYDMLNGNRNYLIVRNTYTTLHGSCYNELLKVINEWNINKLFLKTKQPLKITCKNGYQIMFVGLDDVQKVKSKVPIKGVITDTWIEEATETSFEDLKEIRRRMRGLSKVAKRETLSFNPLFKTHWIYTNLFPSNWRDDSTRFDGDESLILKTTYKDNLFLEKNEIDYLESQKGWDYQVYTLGNWGVLGDLVFPNWQIADLEDIYKVADNIDNGLDFGFANDPTAMIRSYIRGNQLFILDEYYKKGITNAVIANDLHPIIGSDTLWCDPAEPKSIQELRELGLKGATSAIKGPGSINFGIQFLNQFEIIVDKRLQNIQNELNIYQYEKDRDGNSINKPVDKNNHGIDALRYGNSYKFMRQKSKAISVRKIGAV